MKKIRVLLLLVSLLFVSSCKKSSPVGELPPNFLTGEIIEINDAEKYISIKINSVETEGSQIEIGDTVYFDFTKTTKNQLNETATEKDIEESFQWYSIGEAIGYLYVENTVKEGKRIYPLSLNTLMKIGNTTET